METLHMLHHMAFQVVYVPGLAARSGNYTARATTPALDSSILPRIIGDIDKDGGVIVEIRGLGV